MEATSTLGRRLREERKRLGLLQPAFAEIGGVKRVTQHLYEQNERVPDANYLLRIHEHGVDILYVLLGKRLLLGKHQMHREITIDQEVLVNIYRAVDDFGRDDMGEPLPLAERQRLFALLVATYSQHSVVPTIDDVRRRLALCLSAIA